MAAISAYAPGTVVRLRTPGLAERGAWRILKPLWHRRSGLAYDLQHLNRGNYRTVPAARVRPLRSRRGG
jgi:hypothetical protein